MTDRQLVQIAREYGKLIVYVPIVSTLAVQEVATVNLLDPRQPVVTRKSPSTTE